MLTVHHLGVSQSDRVVWLLEELEIPYQMVWYDRGADRLAPPEYLALHPAASAPVIEDDGRVLAESEAILPYICHRHAGGRLTVAPDADNYADYLYWLALSNNLLGLFFAKMVATDTSPPTMLHLVKRREDGYLDFLEQTLATRPYLAGDDFTCADIMSLFLLRNPRMLADREAPHTKAWIERLTTRPAFIKADAIAGPGATRPSDS